MQSSYRCFPPFELLYRLVISCIIISRFYSLQILSRTNLIDGLRIRQERCTAAATVLCCHKERVNQSFFLLLVFSSSPHHLSIFEHYFFRICCCYLGNLHVMLKLSWFWFHTHPCSPFGMLPRCMFRDYVLGTHSLVPILKETEQLKGYRWWI